jgi:hypothetical protein
MTQQHKGVAVDFQKGAVPPQPQPVSSDTPLGAVPPSMQPISEKPSGSPPAGQGSGAANQPASQGPQK